MAPTMGRPKSENPKSERMDLRVTPSEKQEIQDFMKQYNISLLGLIQKGMKAIKKE